MVFGNEAMTGAHLHHHGGARPRIAPLRWSRRHLDSHHVSAMATLANRRRQYVPGGNAAG
jgi:hypothetical protein